MGAIVVQITGTASYRDKTYEASLNIQAVVGCDRIKQSCTASGSANVFNFVMRSVSSEVTVETLTSLLA